ncbi:MAG: hypothetical protein R3324_12350 [Halobacteriales archaeon]|nr:hypothetical protein [Halobacteriales archaeon]
MSRSPHPVGRAGRSAIAVVAGFVLAVGGVAGQEAWFVENLGPPVNTETSEAFPTIAADGLVLYFARRTSGSVEGESVRSWDLWVAERETPDGEWSEPRRLPDHINTVEGDEHSVSVSPDGHWLYFSSTALGSRGSFDIFRSYREDVSDPLDWGEPENLGDAVNTAAAEVCVIYHAEEGAGTVHLYFVSDREGSMGHLDVWRIEYDPTTETYSEAEPVTAVNSPAFDGHLDPLAGYVWSSREGSMGRDDIWFAPRDSEGNWLTPVHAGPGLNTEYGEGLPSPLDSSGDVLFFSSNRPGGAGGSDLYVAVRGSDGSRD